MGDRWQEGAVFAEHYRHALAEIASLVQKALPALPLLSEGRCTSSSSSCCSPWSAPSQAARYLGQQIRSKAEAREASFYDKTYLKKTQSMHM